MLICALTYLHTSVYGFSHFSASRWRLGSSAGFLLPCLWDHPWRPQTGQLTMLLKTIVEILLLFLTFMYFQDLCGISGSIGFGSSISDTDANYTICFSRAHNPRIKTSPCSSPRFCVDCGKLVDLAIPSLSSAQRGNWYVFLARHEPLREREPWRPSHSIYPGSCCGVISRACLSFIQERVWH
jgi:hypothetical protein